MFKDFFADVIELKDEFMTYLRLETDYLKLTVTEKLVKITTSLVFIIMAMVTGVFVSLMLSFALAYVFMLFLPGWAAFLCTAGVFVLLLLMFFLLRRPLIMNPISKAVTRALFKKPQKSRKDDDEDED